MARAEKAPASYAALAKEGLRWQAAEKAPTLAAKSAAPRSSVWRTAAAFSERAETSVLAVDSASGDSSRRGELPDVMRGSPSHAAWWQKAELSLLR